MLSHSLPKTWRATTLELHAEIRTGVAKGKRGVDAPVTRPYLRVANVQDGYLDLREIKSIEVARADVQRYCLKFGDVLLTEGGDFDKLGRGTVWRGEIEDCLHQNHVFAVRPNQATLLPEFLAYQAASPYGKRYFQACSKQSTNLASINSTQLRQFPLLLPPIVEQRRIAEILQSWDEAIETTERLITAKECLFNAFTVSLFKGNRRCASDASVWSKVGFADVTSELTERNAGRYGESAVMGVNKLHGMIPTQDHVRSSDLTRYKIVPANAFAYNPMRLNIGSLAINDHGADVLVSPDYVAFVTRQDRLDHRFFDHLRRTSIWRQFVTFAGTGSVRVRIYYEHLAAFSLSLPPIEIQRHLADIIDAAALEIKLLTAKRTALDRQKRGLMQKLLTGEWRVPLRDGEVDDLAERAAKGQAA